MNVPGRRAGLVENIAVVPLGRRRLLICGFLVAGKESHNECCDGYLKLLTPQGYIIILKVCVARDCTWF